MSADVELAKKLFDEFQDTHREVFELLRNLSESAKKKLYSRGDLADLGYLCREISKLADDIRKDCNAHQNLLGKLLSMSVIQDPDVQDDVRGTLATATPTVTRVPLDLPRQSVNPERFAQTMEFFGVPKDKWDIVKLDWKKVESEITRRMEEGEKSIPGIGPGFPRFGCIYRKRRTTDD